MAQPLAEAQSAITVIVKWGKWHKAVELDKSEPVELFKAQLFSLTDVLVERRSRRLNERPAHEDKAAKRE